MWINAFPHWLNLDHVSRVEVVKRRPGDEPELSLTVSQPGCQDLVITNRPTCDRVLAWLENESSPKLIPSAQFTKKQEKSA